MPPPSFWNPTKHFGFVLTEGSGNAARENGALRPERLLTSSAFFGPAMGRSGPPQPREVIQFCNGWSMDALRRSLPRIFRSMPMSTGCLKIVRETFGLAQAVV